MDWGYYIKRSWQITWRYKALWVLGLFAGVSGCQGSSGGNGGSSRTDFGSGSTTSSPFTPSQIDHAASQILHYVPLIIAAVLLLFVIWIVWSVLSIAARGGLVTAVNEAETVGVPSGLGALWGSGFSHFWTLVGVDIFLRLPILVATLVMVVLAVVPILGAVAGTGAPGFTDFIPTFMVLGIGLPVILVGSLVLGVMHPLAVRYVVLGGQTAATACANSWRFLRARVKDSVLMYLLNAVLNVAAAMVITIPVVVIGLGTGIGIAAAAINQEWGVLAGSIGLLIAFVMVISFIYSAIWGTYTSSLWTLFFRDVTGMRTVTPVPARPIVEQPVSPVPEPPTGPAMAAPVEPPAPPMTEPDA